MVSRAQSPQDACQTAERLRALIAEHPVSIGPEREPIPVSVSIGLHWFEATAANDSDRLITQADRALYAAKHAGRNAVRTSLAPQGANTPVPPVPGPPRVAHAH